MDGQRINKLLLTLVTGMLALASTSTVADALDTKPISKMTIEEAQAARSAAKAKWDNMTPEEKAAVKKGVATKRREQLTAMESVAIQWDELTDCEKQQRYARLIPQGGAMHPVACPGSPTPKKQERQRELEQEERKQHQQ